MGDTIFECFLDNLKKTESKNKNIKIEGLTFEEFQVSLSGDGKIDLQKIASLYQWSKEILKIRANQIDFFAQYCQKSPRFWLKDVGKKEEIDEDKFGYTVGLNLEVFIPSQKRSEQKDMIAATGSFIPDNYELAKKVMKEFRKIPENKKFKIEDNSYRDTAMWQTEDKEAALALGNFIQEKYIEPEIAAVLKSFGAKGVKFNKKRQIDFIY